MRLASLFLPLALALASCSSSAKDIGRKERMLYVALGASDAFGIGANPVTGGYVYRIREALDRQVARVDLINLGIPGAEIDMTAESLRAFLGTRAQPDLVTVWTGANDVIAGRLVPDFESALGDMFRRLREHSEALVVVANVPDLTQLPRFRMQPVVRVTRERIGTFNAVIARQAERHRVPVVDLFAQPVEPELVSDADGFHPSNAGHSRIAQLFLDVIQPALGLERQRIACANGADPTAVHERERE